MVVQAVEQDHLIQLLKVDQVIHLLLVQLKEQMEAQETHNQIKVVVDLAAGEQLLQGHQIKVVVVLVAVEQLLQVHQIKFFLVQATEILEEMVEQD